MKKGKLTRKVFALLLTLSMVMTYMPAMTMTAFAEGNVAKIGTIEYATLAEAVADAKTGDTITLLADVTASKDDSGMVWFLGKSGSFTFDCNGHTLTGGITDGYSGAADITVKGIKSVETTYTKDETGKMLQCAALWNYQNDMVVENGEFTATNAVVMQYNGTVTLNDGTYIMKREEGPVVVSSGGTTTINGGTYKGAEGISNVCAISAEKNGTVNVHGGTFYGYLEAKDGGQINIDGGTFSVDPTNYLNEKHTATKVGDVWIVDYKEPQTTNVAKIGETEYATLADAVAAAEKAGRGEITLLETYNQYPMAWVTDCDVQNKPEGHELAAAYTFHAFNPNKGDADFSDEELFDDILKDVFDLVL